MTACINILIADDHNLILDGFEYSIRQEYPNAKIGKARTKAELLHILKTEPISVLFQDVLFGQDDARTFTGDLKEQYPRLKIIIISTLIDSLSVNNLLKQGVDGYVSKTDESSELINALKAVEQGQLYLSHDIRQSAVKIVKKNVFITQREEKVLRLIVQGCTSKQISGLLNISVKTVEAHRANLFARFGVKNVVELVKNAMFEGYS